MVTINADKAIGPAHFKGFREKGEVLITSIFRTLQGEAPYSGMPAVFVRTAGCNYGLKSDFCRFCFVDNTPIVTNRGTITMGSVAVGDVLQTYVGNYPYQKGETTVQSVQTRDVHRNDLVVVNYRANNVDNSLICTRDHPFNTRDRKFVEAGRLIIGDQLIGDSKAEVTSVQPVADEQWAKISFADTAIVVNFTCAPYNTFVVGGVHVHNCDTAFQFAAGKRMTFAQLDDAVNAIKKPGDLLVLTGGEPTLQYALIDWLKTFDPDDWHAVQFESNGTQFKFYEEVERTQFPIHPIFVVSPKASYKTGKYPKLHPSVLHDAFALKFVLEPDKDSPQHVLPDWALESASNQQVLVSPAAYYLRRPESEAASAWDHTLIDAERTEQSYRYAAWYVMQHPHIRLSIQTHLFAALP